MAVAGSTVCSPACRRKHSLARRTPPGAGWGGDAACGAPRALGQLCWAATYPWANCADRDRHRDKLCRLRHGPGQTVLIATEMGCKQLVAVANSTVWPSACRRKHSLARRSAFCACCGGSLTLAGPRHVPRTFHLFDSRTLRERAQGLVVWGGAARRRSQAEARNARGRSRRGCHLRGRVTGYLRSSTRHGRWGERRV